MANPDTLIHLVRRLASLAEEAVVAREESDDDEDREMLDHYRALLDEARVTVVLAEREVAAQVQVALIDCLRAVDAEIEQRKVGGGTPELWSGLQKISDQGHAALRRAEAVLLR